MVMVTRVGAKVGCEGACAVPVGAVAALVGVSRAATEAGGVGLKEGVGTGPAVVGVAGCRVGGTSTPETGRASAIRASCVPDCHCMGSADPARCHSATAPSSSGMAMAIASRSRSRTPFYPSPMLERGTRDRAGRDPALLVFGLMMVPHIATRVHPPSACPTCIRGDFVTGRLTDSRRRGVWNIG